MAHLQQSQPAYVASQPPPSLASTLAPSPACSQASLAFVPELIQRHFNVQPFGFSHNLHTLDLFQPDALQELCRTFTSNNRGFFIAEGAASAGTAFYAVPHGGYTPAQAMEMLGERPLRILLKRPETQDARFRVLLDGLFEQVLACRGELRREEVIRLESAILITSAKTITPLHFDPEVGCFSQIEGEKTYHVYSPDDTSEREMERFYIRGVVDIASLEMQNRNAAHEHVFELRPGLGLHQPQNAPHWVETSAGRSVSYTFVFETKQSRRLARTRAFNYYQRKLGMAPLAPGVHPRIDAGKAQAMKAVLPVRQAVGNLLRSMHVRG